MLNIVRYASVFQKVAHSRLVLSRLFGPNKNGCGCRTRHRLVHLDVQK
jgi:hypothetical protein